MTIKIWSLYHQSPSIVRLSTEQAQFITQTKESSKIEGKLLTTQHNNIWVTVESVHYDRYRSNDNFSETRITCHRNPRFLKNHTKSSIIAAKFSKKVKDIEMGILIGWIIRWFFIEKLDNWLRELGYGLLTKKEREKQVHSFSEGIE